MAFQIPSSAFKEAEQRCKKAGYCLEQAAKNNNALFIQEALRLYQEVLAMELEIEEPYLGLAYLTLCAENYPITERLLCSAERINPASPQVFELRKQLKIQAQNRFEMLDQTPVLSDPISRIQSQQTPQKISRGNMPRSLQRIFGPIEGLFNTTQELREAIYQVFDQEIAEDKAHYLFNLLHCSEPIDLAKTLKEVHLLLGEIHPRCQQKLSAFAEELSLYAHEQKKILSPYSKTNCDSDTLH